MQKKLLLVPFLLASPLGAYAEEYVDPANVTKLYSQAAILASGNANVQLQAQVSGAITETQSFALLGEVDLVSDGDNANNSFGANYAQSRFQYFHIIDTTSESLPSVGFSVDYINVDTEIKNDILSIGAIASINPKYTAGILIFPRVGYTTGNIVLSGVDEDVNGYNAGIFAVKRIGNKGAHLAFIPEYQDMSGDSVDMNNFAFKAAFNLPINEDRTVWLNTRLDYGKTTMKINNHKLESDWESDVWVGLRYYF
ncbi:hypothetical protein [Thaumasiovibrio sp. DFM-14]|uniref:hypothetical protein n=1 Tax=Thaumasiovibrio sp. DFM-14 TaxID=3384792 RepID=UPI0039A1F5AA